MHSTVIFLASLLISFSLATASTKSPILAEVEAHPFGRTIMNLVQMQFKMEHPIDEISQYLGELQSNLQGAQAESDTEHADFQDACTSSLSTFSANIDSYSTSLDTANKAYQTAVDTEASKKSDLQTQSSDLATDQADLQAAEDQNVADSAAFDKNDADLKDAIQACSDALDLLSRLNSSPASLFIQLSSQISSKLEKIRDQLAKHLPASLTIYTPILDALTQLKNKADPGAVQQVSDLIGKLQAELEKHLSSLEDAEENRETNFNETVSNLNDNIDRLNAVIDGLNADIVNSEAEQTFQQQQINTYTALLASEKDNFDAETTKCNNEETNYDDDKESRTSELALLQQLIDHFNDKLAGMSDYLKDRTSF